jgi:hypothetical protein
MTLSNLYALSCASYACVIGYASGGVDMAITFAFMSLMLLVAIPYFIHKLIVSYFISNDRKPPWPRTNDNTRS